MEVSLPWYASEEDFKAILAMVPASESATAFSYERWVERIKGIEAQFIRDGNTPIRVTIDPQAVKMWCDENGVLVCRASISQYATLQHAKKAVNRRNN